MPTEAEPSYTITLTRSQAQVLMRAAEVYARVGFGQIGDALDHLPSLVDKCGVGWETRGAVEDILSPVVGFNMRNSSLGVGNKNASPGSDTAWDIYTLIRHRLSWDRAVDEGIVALGAPRKWPEMMTVNYDEPSRYGDGPPATIRKAS